MPDVVEKPEMEFKAFPVPAGMAPGLFLTAIGLFLVLGPTPPIVKVLGFILFLIGVIIFAL